MEGTRAQRFLAQMQKSSYVKLGINPSSLASAQGTSGGAFLDRYLAATFGDLAEEALQRQRALMQQSLREAVEAVPTPYEDPLRYSLLRRHARDIEVAAMEKGMELGNRPLFGTLPTGQVNGATYLVPGTTEHVVVLEKELFTFALLLSKAICCTLPLDAGTRAATFATDVDDIKRRIEQQPELAERFTELILAYTITGRPSTARPYWPERPYQTLAGVLRRSIELFVLGHEYGHVVAGHLLEMPATSEDATAIAYSWRQEYAADEIGIMLCLRVMDEFGCDTAMSFWGADGYFSGIDIMDRATSLLLHGYEERQKLSSHPPSQERREHLRQALPELLNPRNGADEHAKATGLGSVVAAIVDELWARSRPTVMAAHKRGFRPARQWTA